MRVILKKRKKNRAGFSLAETLIAILILLMVSAIVAGAIPAASNVYAKTVDAANAQVLLSTVITVLRDELSTATNISATGTTVEYINGSYRRLVLQGKGTNAGDPAAGIWLCVGALPTNPTEGMDPTYSVPGDAQSRLIVSSEATTKNLSVSFTSVEFVEGTVIFHGLQVDRDGKTLASRSTFTIRTVK